MNPCRTLNEREIKLPFIKPLKLGGWMLITGTGVIFTNTKSGRSQSIAGYYTWAYN